MVTVKEEIKRFAQKHLARLENHVKTSRYQLTCHKEKTEEDNTFGPCVIVMWKWFKLCTVLNESSQSWSAEYKAIGSVTYHD